MDWFSNFIFLSMGITDMRAGIAADKLWAVLVTNADWAKPLTEAPVLADISANLCTASGYTEQQLTGTPVIANDFANQRVTLSFTLPSFGNIAIGQTVAACVVYYKDTLETLVNPLVCVIEGTDKATTGGAFTVTVPTPPAYISAIRNS